ncbi:MAG: hypothetical protein WBC44_15375 [Planctomycetaceae bacterium]
MTRVVEVRTGARLHFGLFATTPGDGPFGGIGMMIDRPRFALQAWRSQRDQVIGPMPISDRVAEFVARVRLGMRRPAVRYQVEQPSAPVAIRVAEVIPSHRGFGSGTQLAYAVAAVVGRVLDVWPPFMPDHELGRGKRSAVGTRGFQEGGFVVDAGIRRRAGLETGVACRKVPSEWRFVVVDPQGRVGPSGMAETSGFAALPPMPRNMPQLLLDLVATTILPGLDDADFLRFARGVAEFNRLVGEHFAPVQGGVYAHPLIRELSQRLAETSWPHLAQSSWGPAAVVFCESDESARTLVAFLGRQITPDQASVFVAAAKNDGAEIREIG